MTPQRLFLAVVALTVPSLVGAGDARTDQQDAWAALAAGGHVALMRHALAPGTGDPLDFDVDDCESQRNLSDEGRVQAKAIGARFRANGIDTARVYSSRWCRCLETARLLGLGDVTPVDALNSFFRDLQQEPERTAAALALIGSEGASAGEQPLVLVTHQVNITALTGVFPASGEIVVVKPIANGIEVVGRIR